MKRHFGILVCALFSLAAVSCDGKREMPVKPDEGGDTPKPSGAKTYYIAPNGDDNQSGIAPAFAKKTFKAVLDLLRPGDVIKVMGGRYEYNGSQALAMKKEHSGTDEKPITIMAADPNDRPVFHVGGRGVWNAFSIEASYVVIDGLELEGWNQQLDSLTALRNAELYRDNREAIDWNTTAQFNTNGLSIGADQNNRTFITHHVTIRNCIVHDFPGGGLGASTSDYITFENNVCYNNAWHTMYACSGISFINPVDLDDYTGYKYRIVGNLCYNNRCKIPWAQTADFRLSDGNGIIIDVNQHGADKSPWVDTPYKGRTLVANNVSIHNGGSGIHAYKADHVDIVNNTAYWNGIKFTEDNNYPEIFAQSANDVNIMNNIMIARQGGFCNNNDKVVNYHHNVYFGPARRTGDGDVQASVNDARVVKLSTNGAEADMHLLEGCIAIGKGIRTDAVPATDKDGVSRGSSIDCGAYQFVKK